jgi:hypothetical protein
LWFGQFDMISSPNSLWRRTDGRSFREKGQPSTVGDNLLASAQRVRETAPHPQSRFVASLAPSRIAQERLAPPPRAELRSGLLLPPRRPAPGPGGDPERRLTPAILRRRGAPRQGAGGETEPGARDTPLRSGGSAIYCRWEELEWLECSTARSPWSLARGVESGAPRRSASPQTAQGAKGVRCRRRSEWPHRREAGPGRDPARPVSGFPPIDSSRGNRSRLPWSGSRAITRYVPFSLPTFPRAPTRPGSWVDRRQHLLRLWGSGKAAIHRGSASMRLTDEAVGTTRLNVNPPSPSNTLNS